MYYSLLIFPELNTILNGSKKSLKKTPRKLTKKRRSKKKCNHNKNFSCYHSEQTVIVNGKKQHKKQNICKCYECGMEF
jgi:hypothetical protein